MVGNRSKRKINVVRNNHVRGEFESWEEENSDIMKEYGHGGKREK